MRTRCLLFLVLAATVASADASFRDEHLEVELICEHARLQAGKTALVGIRFVLQPGWHVYWKNPGDSALPPRVEWELPDDYEVSGLMWPAPRRISVPPLMTFGYDEDVMLLAELFVPQNAAGTTASIVAHVSWMTCADLCFQGEATLALELPVASAAPQRNSAWITQIEVARARLPKLPPPGALNAVRDGDDIRLLVSGATPEAYFPANAGEIDYRAPQTKDQGTLWLRSADPEAPPESLRGVLALTRSRAWIVDVPVVPVPKPAPYAGPSWAFYLGAGLVVALFLIALIYFFA
jgi:thiol:disulfide interchange protein DsbD